MSEQEIRVPDLGGADEVEITEILVKAGDTVAAEDAILEVESDKASVELPSPGAGTVKKITVKVGDKVREGDLVGYLDAESEAGEESENDDESGDDSARGEKPDEPDEADKKDSDKADSSEPPQSRSKAGKGGGKGEERTETVHVPDLGGAENVPVIDIQVRPGDTVEVDDPLVTVESDKASMDIPSPSAGTVKSVSVREGDTVSEGDPLLQLSIKAEQDSGESSEEADREPEEPETPAKAKRQEKPQTQQSEVKPEPSGEEPAAAVTPEKPPRVHAGPAVRKLAREFGVELTQVRGSGPSRRILKEDVQSFVKHQLQEGPAPGAATGGSGIPPVKLPDFSQFGETERLPMSGLDRATADAMQRSWLNVPHVTQFEQADITDMEAFRQSLKAEGEKKGVKLTPMPFLLKAMAAAMAHYPQFNVSLDMPRQEKIQKHYIHIGIAVDTPAGLVVPVIRDVASKGLWQLAREAQELAEKARNRKLTREDMSGACATITSLGGIGGTAFTPIVNAPEVAILGVSKATTQPVWDGESFQPRLMLPLSLSYDHRAVNGADAARFTSLLGQLLGDTRRLLL
ncbi:MAG: dihydrolipoyllysine-residue acetyltransferase [Oleiphilaceae bacterium]|nr:dihydrolipoyllysine-residue acetyltransferase [Oleiphilaceae bacterium]